MLSASSRHAIRALIYLASAPESEYFSVSELAACTELPKAYLSKIIHTLAGKSIVKTKKGVSGGVALCKESTSFFDICEALDDPIIRDSCFLSAATCDERSPCKFHDSWSKERRRLLEFLKSNKIQKDSQTN